MTFGSVCSGIEASRLAFSKFGYKQLWSSEIAEFPSKVLEHHYSDVPNVGDMINIPQLILNKEIDAPDLFCGGTPCQAFSLAGWQNGLDDKRGQLTMTFIEIANAIDKIRHDQNKEQSIVLWENVEGVLNDKTNAFGNFIAGLAGFTSEITVSKWSKSGYLEGPTRNVAWRVLDAKYFGLPQQRKRLYVVAGGKDFRPDKVLFEYGTGKNLGITNSKKQRNLNFDQLNLVFENQISPIIPIDRIFFKDGIKFQIFREYTDCLYAAYGTKWNGNAAAYNGSLYIAQDDRLRRFTPLECERLMGIPDNYTFVAGNSHTNRYQAIGNSWAVPVIEWIGNKINESRNNNISDFGRKLEETLTVSKNSLNANLFLLGKIIPLDESLYLNTSSVPNEPINSNIKDIIQVEDIPGKFFLTPQACKGILRRKLEKQIRMNTQLESIMIHISEKIQELESV